MEVLLGFLLLALSIALVVGLVKPEIVLRWSKKPTRLKVFGYWILSIFIIGIIISILPEDKVNDKENSQTNIGLAEQYISDGNYNLAITTLKIIPKDDTLFNNAQILINKADSLRNLSEEQKRLAQEEADKKRIEEKKQQTREQLEREIKSIRKGIDFSTYRGSIDALQMEIVLFGTWANIILENEKSDDSKIKNLVKQLKPKVSRLQTKEFPILRKEYTKIVANKVWENDIEVYANGTGKKYINFTGGVFASNKNIKAVQTELNEILTTFRFKQSRFRWYKGEDEYTYYTTYKGKDSDLVTFGK